MTDLIPILTVIALADSLSMVPLAALPMTIALGSDRPWALSGAFVAGVYAAYFACGIPLMVSAEIFFDLFGAYLSRLWNQPNALELAFQIFLGILLMLSPWLLRRSKDSQTKPNPKAAGSPTTLFVLGATLVLVGIPGAVPYLAAIERIVSHDPDWAASATYLAYYNFVFILPFLCLIGFRFVMPRRAGKLFQVLAAFCLSVMPRLTALLFFTAGIILVADGIGWFFGFPLLPVSG